MHALGKKVNSASSAWLRSGPAHIALAVALALNVSAQTWGTPFNHETINSGPVPNPNATDHLVPFGGYTNGNISYFQFPTGLFHDWQQRFNAVHMCLIPKGPNQGKVLVWGAAQDLMVGAPVLIRSPGTGPSLLSGQYHACAPWSIIDPALTPVGPRFRNFLLPLEVFNTPPPGATEFRAASLFCVGQTWSPYGDLIVAGGTLFGIPTLQGAQMTFAFNPRLPTRGWPTSLAIPLYPGEYGLWEPGSTLLSFSRFYPTTTLTARLNRLGGGVQPPREVVVVSGGSVDDISDDPLVNVTWNNYEALVVSSEASLTFSGITADIVAGQTYWSGPGSPGAPPPVEEDWLEDYPRMHLLSTGELLFSGYAPRWAKVDHDLNPGVWLRQLTAPWSSTTWQFPRHDGTSLLFPNVGGIKDMVVRLGGADEVNYAPAPNGTTSTVEAFFAQGAGGFWANAGNLPNPQPGTLPDGRYLMNVVILPDASLLVLGGTARRPPTPTVPAPPNVPVLAPLLYKNGAWSVLPPNPTSSVRDYHSSAVLLPDGRVFCGGGNGRNFDYEVFSPAYMALPKPQNVSIAAPFDNQWTAHVVNYGVKYHVSIDPLPLGEYISKVVLLAPGAATHHSDMHMRYFELPWTQTLDTTAPTGEITAPPDDKHAPRGNYMMFVVTSSGAVADAIWVVLR